MIPQTGNLGPADVRSLTGAVLAMSIALPGLSSGAAPDEASVDAELSALLKETGIPGITFSLFGKDASRSYASGYADREAGTPMQPDAIMMGASTGKMLVAVLAYQEVQRGRLHYSDKVERYFARGSAYHELPGAAQFTVSMLLRHSTGLVDGAVDAAAMSNPLGSWTNDRRFQAARGTQLLFQPGTAFSYSDLNYQILAAVVESIEREYFGDLAETKILRPLGMRPTAPAIQQDIPGLASGYAGPTSKPQYEDIKLPDKTADAGRLFMTPAFEGGGGGFSTNSPDMAKFIYSVFNSGLVGHRELSQMISRPVPIAERGAHISYAAGLFMQQTDLGTAYGHSGIWFGFKTLVLYYPHLRVGAAMQINSQIDGDGNDLAVYRLDGRRLSMAEVLSQLVRSSLRTGHD
jgi:CubicO group peptidase (beta-lactamase class C family)